MGKHLRGPEGRTPVQDIDGIDLSGMHTRHNRKERGFFGIRRLIGAAAVATVALLSVSHHNEPANHHNEVQTSQIELAASSAEICAATVPEGGGNVSSHYGDSDGRSSPHGGIDCPDEIGSPIKAAQSGTVIDAGPASGYGQWVRVQHEDGTIGEYGHMETINVSVGQQVNAGDVIAGVGNRGESTGAHLHFEVKRPGGGSMNPEHANLNVNPSAPAPQPQLNQPNTDPRASAPLVQGFEDLVQTLPGQQGFEVPAEVDELVERLMPMPVLAVAETTTPIQAEAIPYVAPVPVYEAPVVAPALPTIEQVQQNVNDGFQELQTKMQQDFANVLAGFPPLPGEPQPQQ